MSIRQHYLPGNESSGGPRHFVFVHTNTWTQPVPGRPGVREHRLRVGFAQRWTRYSGRAAYKPSGEAVFTDVNRWWEWLLWLHRRRDRLWIVSHDAYHHMTILCLWSQIENGPLWVVGRYPAEGDPFTDSNRARVKWQGTVAVEGSPFIVECRSVYGPSIYVDVRNYWPKPLTDLAIKAGVTLPREPAESSADEECIEYCRAAVTAQARLVAGLAARWRAADLGNWKPTASGLAMNAYRHRFKHEGMLIHTCSKVTQDAQKRWTDPPAGCECVSCRVADLERRAYHTGRADVYFAGDVHPAGGYGSTIEPDLFSTGRPSIPGPVYYLDAVSAYGAVMKDSPYPVQLVSGMESPELAAAEEMARKYGAIADVSLKAFRYEYPYRPGAGDAEVVYPRGVYRTQIAGPELLRAFNAREVTAVHHIACYQMDDCFHAYMKFFWQMRRQARLNGDSSMDELASMCMKCLHGKFSQLRPAWRLDPVLRPDEPWGPFVIATVPPVRGRAIAGHAYVYHRTCRTRNTFTAVSAFATSYLRVLMDSYKEFLPPRSLLYQDTDSLFVTQAGYDALNKYGCIDEDTPGRLKVKGTYSTLSFRGVKNYDRGSTRVVAGLKPGSAEMAIPGVYCQQLRESSKLLGARTPDGGVHEWANVYVLREILSGRRGTPEGWTKPLVID